MSWLRYALGPTQASWHPSVQFWEAHGPAPVQLDSWKQTPAPASPSSGILCSLGSLWEEPLVGTVLARSEEPWACPADDLQATKPMRRG